MTVERLLNPCVFSYKDSTWLLLRVAERPKQQAGMLSLPVLLDGKAEILKFDAQDPLLDQSDPQQVRYDSEHYPSTLSHLRLFNSPDGLRFEDTRRQLLIGTGGYASFGVEDCRLSCMESGEYVLTYTTAASNGQRMGLRRTRDWQLFAHEGMIFLPNYKECAIFEEPVLGRYACLCRPSDPPTADHTIWLSFSDDLRHWWEHHCIAQTRTGHWDSTRIGAGSTPIKTDAGWLVLYHGADETGHTRLGAMLLEPNNPTRVLARSAALFSTPGSSV